MAEFLALEWEHDQISGVQAQVAGGRVRVRRAFVLPRPVAPAAGSGLLAPVDWLKSELASQGISAGEVLAALPRDEALVKRMELPETSDDELPVIVRFQAAAKSSVPIDDLSLDFIPLPRRSDVPGREVLMATVPQQTITEVRTVCEVAGLHLTGLSLTPAVAAELVARAEAGRKEVAGGASLLVARHGTRLEISVLRNSCLLFAHSARLSSDMGAPEPQAIVSEISRALVALRGAVSDVKIERAWTLFSETEHDEVSDVLERRLACEVLPLDPIAAVDWDHPVPAGLDHTLLVGPIGLLLAKAEPRVPALDFLAPRKPPVKRDMRKRRLAMLGIGAGVLALLLLLVFAMKLRGLDGEIATLQEQQNSLAELLKRGTPQTSAAAAIDAWEDSDMQWFEELEKLSRVMPDTDRIFLSSVQFEPPPTRTLTMKTPGKKTAPAAAAVPTPAIIRVKGFARDQKDIADLSERLHNADDRYSVVAPNRSESKADPLYPWQFDTEILLVEAPAAPKAKAAAKPQRPAVAPEQTPHDKKPPAKAEAPVGRTGTATERTAS